MAGPLIRPYAGAQRPHDFVLSYNRVKLLWGMARTPRLARRSLALARLRNTFNGDSHIRSKANFPSSAKTGRKGFEALLLVLGIDFSYASGAVERPPTINSQLEKP